MTAKERPNTMLFVSSRTVLVLLVLGQTARSETKDLGRGYQDHGAASRVSSHRGIVATVDGEGRNVALVWLMDHRGGYELLLVDAETGRHREVPVPFPPKLDSPYASILSSGNKFYTHFGNHFVEFDPVEGSFTFCAKTAHKKLFFVFDPVERKVVYRQDTVDEFGGVRWQQGPRAFVLGPDQTVYLLCAKGIAKVDPASSRVAMLAESPVTITAGGDMLNGRIYFAGTSHVYSYGLPSLEE